MPRNWLRATLLCCLALSTDAAALGQTLVLKGGSVYASPEATPIADAVVVTSAGVITAVGRAGDVPIPPDARVIDCAGKTIVAGFWNSHVHFTEAPWTDVGFTQLYDTTLEYELMRRVLTERQVLASLTSNPASYFKAAKKGRVEQGYDADLVVLDGDPVADVRNLARVAATVRAGRVIYRKP